jgi:hypothetical protein
VYQMAVGQSMAEIVGKKASVKQAVHDGGVLDHKRVAMWLDTNLALHGNNERGGTTTFGRLPPLDRRYARHLKPNEATRLVVRLRQEAAEGMGLQGAALWRHEAAVFKDDMHTFKNEQGAVGLINDMPTVDLPWDLKAVTSKGSDVASPRPEDLLIAYTSAAGFAQPLAHGPMHLRSTVLPSWDTSSLAERDHSGAYLPTSTANGAQTSVEAALTDRRVYDGATGDRVPRDPFFRLADGSPDPTPTVVLAMTQAFTARGRAAEIELDRRMYPDKLVIRFGGCGVHIAKFGIDREKRQELWDSGKATIQSEMTSARAMQYLEVRTKEAEKVFGERSAKLDHATLD